MHRYGLKLWSTNKQYIGEAARLFDNGDYSYIELFVVPGSYEEYISLWSSLEIPFVVHAPHFDFGVNLSDRSCMENNLLCIAETLEFADRLKAPWAIIHPGIDGMIEETAYQIKKLNDQRLVIENKPYCGRGDSICTGNSPEEIQYVIANTSVNFCLDIGHAICAANARGIDRWTYLLQFLALSPIMFHLSDGDSQAVRDDHKHFGTGNYDLVRLLTLLGSDATITIETCKDHPDSLSDFELDISYIKNIAFLDSSVPGANNYARQ